jgi:protein-S-isoprenylcysteine O-methyltransferase
MNSPSLFAALAILAFWAIEFTLRKGASARSSERGKNDKGSTFAILFAYLVVALTLCVTIGGPQLPYIWRWTGVAVAFFGVTVRVVAFSALGGSYSRTLKVEAQQGLVTSGIYRVLRHPGYAGSIMIWSGAAAAGGSILALVLVFVLLVAVYAYRIRSEEHMLVQYFGEQYENYKKTSWRLIPFLY